MGGVLHEGVLNGTAQSYTGADFSTPDGRMLMRLTRDVWQFASAKNYQQMRDMTLALVDENNKLRNFNEFEEAAKKINDKYNRTWLRTEYDHSIGSSTMASRWAEFQTNAEDQPFLIYRTVGDQNVRHEHQLLNGIIRKITDAFWRKYYPPNGWKCRCDVEQLSTQSAVETQVLPRVPIDSMFDTNLAVTGMVFPKGHAYYKGVPADVMKRAVGSLPDNVAYNTVIKDVEGGKRVDIHIYHGVQEAAENIDIASGLIDSGYNVKLLPVLEKADDDIREFVYKSSTFRKGKNPDALVNKKLFEFKTINGNVTRKTMQRKIYQASKQAENILLKLPEEISTNDIDRAVDGLFNQSKTIKEVWIDNGGNLIKKQNSNYTK
ncbi:phage minor head protein [Carboxylicivirga linearis]|uniref:Minor capsid protein n=1 Tax=Carboxylicivirga linearis TaxID=1628157 RepID=A0ABS5K0K8_9BACT|nr:phage minor head protein [Carboxylicivirga linearis]MBS2100698.1 minor capsid protein [Carboxylicivirga linearis]